ncbi:MAG: sulfite exporter TauE/SafE family protein [Jatrophihabitantaceae bacterium]
MDWTLVVGAFAVGIVVGLTGMGGGALMTPMLVLFFGVSPLAAVSSDLAASAIMKPVGSIVHFRNGSVRLDLVRWLCLGSVPAAFCGVLVARALGHGSNVENLIQKALGIALVIAATGLFVRAYLRLAERAAHRDGRRDADPTGRPDIVVRPGPTVAVGAVGGLVVGMTSVGSGSLIIIALMMLYPTLRASELVGTDLVQAVPLVASAALGHMIFGDLQLGITGALLVGSVPGAFIGAQLSSRLPGALIRRALCFVLLASALKLLGASNVVTGVVLVALLLLAPPAWMLLRRHHGFSAFARTERRREPVAPTLD